MTLALFDLDNTLLADDSDYLWGEFLAQEGIVDGPAYQAENQRFYDQYLAGTLDIHEFLRFQLAPLASTDPSQLEQLRERFLVRRIEPLISGSARKLISDHVAQGHTPVIITATNRFITGPIAERFGITHLIATEPASENGRYTGEVEGVPCFQYGKITRLEAWMKETGTGLDGSWFYSDSHNDLPLLERVDHPVAVDPDPKLKQHAEQRCWPVISLRE